MSDVSSYVKPLPVLDADSRPYWAAAAAGRLILRRCTACGLVYYYPRAICGRCWSAATEWIDASGRGKIYSFSVVYDNRAPGFRDEVPYVLAYVELDEGPRMLTNVVDCAPDQVQIDMPVEVVFERVSDEIGIPRFRLRSA
ncbi:MAG: Zn-ribbon domain-containing OB-fold protein [Chloroflexi bacterium]|nr:Zn-ribbon domain-containing OB-fold protein [Chloroflexota bacterium]